MPLCTPVPSLRRKPGEATRLKIKNGGTGAIDWSGVPETVDETSFYTRPIFTSAYPGLGLMDQGARLGIQVVPSVIFGIESSLTSAVARSDGYGLTDTSGLLTPGAKSASFRDVTTGGTIGAFWDFSTLSPTNQGLIVRSFYRYDQTRRSYGNAPDFGIIGLDVGSQQQASHTFGGSVKYWLDRTYLRGAATFDTGRGSLSNNANGGSGDYTTSGYKLDMRIGQVFTLARGITYGPPAGYTKAPPKPITSYMIGLDVSGHLGYASDRAGAFTDSAGFVYGDERARYGDIGARAKLFALMPGYDLLWRPYIGATVDQLFGLSHTAVFPNQVHWLAATSSLIRRRERSGASTAESTSTTMPGTAGASAPEAFTIPVRTPASQARTSASAFRFGAARRWSANA